jgi:hypothetical protein
MMDKPIKKYPGLKVVLGYTLFCPGLAGVFMLFIAISYTIFHNITTTVTESNIEINSVAVATSSDVWMLVGFILLFPLVGIVTFGIPFFLLSIAFAGSYKVKDKWAYILAVGWVLILVLFFVLAFNPPPSRNIDEAGIYFLLASCFSLSSAAMITTWWVLPKKYLPLRGCT